MSKKSDSNSIVFSDDSDLILSQNSKDDTNNKGSKESLKERELTHSSDNDLDISTINNIISFNLPQEGTNIEGNNIQDQIKETVLKKIYDGYIPFFIEAKGYQSKFFYGKYDSQFINYLKEYIIFVKENELLNHVFYNDEHKIIDKKKNIKDLGINFLSTIRD